MQRGLSEYVAVVLLIGIATIGSITLFFWMAGQTTQQQTPSNPLPLNGKVIASEAGYLKVLIVNLGDKSLPSDGVLVVAENGARAVLITDLKPNNQQMTWFWGRYDKEDGYEGFNERATIFETTTGSWSPTLQVPNVEAANSTAYDVFTAEGFEPSISTIEDKHGMLWLVFTSNESIGSHDIWVMNSTDGINWNTPFTIAAQGFMIQEDSPSMAYNGTFYVLYRSWHRGVGELNPPCLKITSSDDGNTWSAPTQTNVKLVDLNPDNYKYTGDNKRGFSLIIDDNSLFWMGYINGTNAAVRNSTDGVTWNSEITVNDSAGSGKTSLMQDSSGKYWFAYVGDDDRTIEVSWSDDANTWSDATIISDEDFGSACTGPSIMQDHSGNYFLFSDQSDSCTDMYVQASVDGERWSRPSWLPNITDSDRHPTVMQDSGGVYRMALANSDSIHVRTSTDPMIWTEV